MGVRILVTGGAGYVGSHTVQVLRTAGHEPVVLDWLQQGHREAVPAEPLVVADVRDRTVLERTLRDYNVKGVIHLAAFKSASDSVGRPAECFSVNIGGTLALIEAMVSAGVRDLVFSSSCAVYGHARSLPVRERTPIRPLNPYGQSKAIGEAMLQWMSGAGALRYVALRYFNAAGAMPDGSLGEDPGAQNLLARVLTSALDGEPLPIYGTDWPTPDGTPIRDYVHVLDLAEAHLAALDHLRSGGPSLVVNLGSGRGTSVREVVDVARRVTGTSIPTVDHPRRQGDTGAIWADHALATKTLGWRPRRSLEDMVESAWRWRKR